MYVIKTVISKTFLFFFNLLQMSFKDNDEIKRLLQELSFYNIPIDKPKIKKLGM